MAELAKANALLRQELQKRKEIQEELESLFDLSLDMLCITGVDGFFKRLNPAFEIILGYTTDELQARPLIDFVHPDDRVATLAEFEKIIAGAPTIQFENRYQHKDGTYRWLSWTAQPVLEKGLVYAVARDITRHKRTEAALLESEKLYRTLIEHAPEAIVVFDVENGHFVDCNRAAERLFGMPRDAIHQTNPVELSPEYQPDGRLSSEAAFEMIQQAVQSQVPHFEWVHRNAQGQDIPCEIWMARLPAPDRMLVRGSINDITARKKAEEALRRTQFMVDSAGDAIFWMKRDARFSNVNEQACRSLGYTREEFRTMTVMDIGPKMTLEAFQTTWETAKEKGAYTYEALHQRKDGRTFPVEIAANYVEHDGSEFLCAIVRDITERKRAEIALAQKAEALARSNEELEQFAYVASHDLQEPLRTISSYVQLIDKRYKNQLDTDADEFIGFIVDAAERMQMLIHDLLAYSRVGRREIKRQAIDVNTVLKRTLAGIQTTLDAADAEITHDELPTIQADATQLSLLLQNLVSNGVKFHGEARPHVHVSAEKKGRRWHFSVRDNGIGIKDVYQDRIFEVFRRLHSRTQYVGTGIGLAICKKIVERHGGRIWVESEEGKGAVFFFTIPG